MRFATNYFAEQNDIDSSGRIQIMDNGDLLIASVKSADVGLYTCIRANEAGEVRGSAFLNVLGTKLLRFRYAIW